MNGLVIRSALRIASRFRIDFHDLFAPALEMFSSQTVLFSISVFTAWSR
jgi:hypothetical protein